MLHLPDDILCEVFSILSVEGYAVGANLAAPCNLAQVSRRWRQTALNHSSLWATITLPITRPTDLLRCSQLPLALERSGKQPLTFSFRSLLPFTDDPASLKHIVPALVALCKESRRWKSAKFCMPTNVIAILLSELEGPFNCLEEIWLEKLEREYGSPYDFSEDVNLPTLFLDAPLLVDMVCDFDIPFQLPWTQMKIVRYHITSNSMIPYLTTIPHLCPLLLHFRAQQWTDDGAQGAITLPADHSVLPHLEVANIDLDPLLDLITAPALKSIAVQSPNEDDHIIPLIERSECYDLECLLAIKHGPINIVHLIHQPKFTKLRFVMLTGPSYDPYAIFSALRDRASLPALENFYVMGHGVSHGGDHYAKCFSLLRVILEVVQARELKVVTVVHHSSRCWYGMRPVDRRLDTTDCLAKLEAQARDRGVDLNIMICGQNFLGLIGAPSVVMSEVVNGN